MKATTNLSWPLSQALDSHAQPVPWEEWLEKTRQALAEMNTVESR